MVFSLFGNRQRETPESKRTQEIELDKTMSSHYQPRHTFGGELIEELTTTLKKQELPQPITLRKSTDDSESEYGIAAGE